MSVVGQGFRVVTEFVFNADQAISGAEALNKQVSKLSNSADMAIQSVQNLGLRYVMTFSGATGGILGVLGNAVKASDKFRATQIELANTMQANRMKMNGSVLSFNDALTQSDFILTKVVKKAREFGINPDALTGQVKMFANMLAPKGLAGNNMSQAIELARVSMKAAPALGVDSNQATGGILSGISGQLSGNTQFGRRLFMESGKEIESATGIKSLKEFNKAIPTKRIKALIVGLDKLAGTTDAVAARADTLSARISTIYDLFAGVGSILKPLGDAILPTIKEALDMIIQYLKTDGAKLIKSVAKFIKSFMGGPKEMLLGLMQLKELSNDIATGIKIGGIALMMAHLKDLVGFLGGNKYTAPIANFVGAISGMIQRIPILGGLLTNLFNSFQKMFHINLSGGFWSFVKSFGAASIRMLGFIGVLLIPLQGLSRALARMKFETLGWFASNLPDIMDSITSLKMSFMKFMSPIQDLISGWSDLFYALLGGTSALDEMKNSIKGIADFAEVLSTAFLALWGTLKGIVAGISAMVGSLVGGKFTGLGDVFAEAQYAEFEKTMNKFRAPTLGPDASAQSTVTNYVEQNVTMNNAFKEVLQPDRIAFTISEQLKKESANRRSAGVTGAAGNLARSF